MNEMALSFRQAKFATVVICLLACLFWIFFDASKHDPALSIASVFAKDPFDAVGSFGFQLAMLATLISFVRIIRPYPSGITSDHLRLILHGDAVVLATIAVTLSANVVAMLRYLPVWASASPGWLLALLTAGLLVLTILAGWMVLRVGRRLHLLAGERAWGRALAALLVGWVVLLFYPEAWRQSIPGALFTVLVGMLFLFVLAYVTAKLIFPSNFEPSEDFLDDLVVLTQWVRSRASNAGFLFRWTENVVTTPWARALIAWMHPRRHAWHWVIVLGVALGIILVGAEIAGEGASNRGTVLLVLVVFIGLEGAGVLLGYALFKQFLGIVRS